MDKEKIQMLSMLKALGIDLNPAAQMGSMVDVINKLEGPDRQRAMFDDELAFKRQEAEAGRGLSREELGQRAGQFDRDLAQRGRSIDMQDARYEKNGLMGLLGQIMQATSYQANSGFAGQMNPQMLIDQIPGLEGLFQQPNVAKSRPYEPGISDEAFAESAKRHGVMGR